MSKMTNILRKNDTPVMVVSSQQDTPITTSLQQDIPIIASLQKDTSITVYPQKDTPSVVSPQKDMPIIVSPQKDTPMNKSPQKDSPSIPFSSSLKQKRPNMVVDYNKDTPIAVSLQGGTEICVSLEEGPVSDQKDGLKAVAVAVKKNAPGQVTTTSKTTTKTWLIQTPKCSKVPRSEEVALKDKKEKSMSDLDKDIEIICNELRKFGSFPTSKARAEDLQINRTVHSPVYSHSRSKSIPHLKMGTQPNDGNLRRLNGSDDSTNQWRLNGTEESTMEMTAQIWNMSPEGKPDNIWDTRYTLYTPPKYVHKQSTNKNNQKEDQKGSSTLEDRSTVIHLRPDVTIPTYVNYSPRMTAKLSHESHSPRMAAKLSHESQKFVPSFSWGDNEHQAKTNHLNYSNGKGTRGGAFGKEDKTDPQSKFVHHQNSQFTPPNIDEKVIYTEPFHSNPLEERIKKRKSRSTEDFRRLRSSFEDEPRELLSPLEKEAKHLRSHAIIRKAANIANIANKRNPFYTEEDTLEDDLGQGQDLGQGLRSDNSLTTDDYCFACDADTQTDKITTKSTCRLM